MSSIKVKLATGGEYYISSPANDLPTNSTFSPQFSNFEWGGTNYEIANYKVDANEDIVNWNAGIEMAYLYITLDPGSLGYPDLGAEITNNIDLVPYLTLDGRESMGRVIQSLGASETEIVDFSLIYSWSTVGGGLTTDDFKVIVGELNTLRAQAATAASDEEQNCADALSGGDPSYTWPDGFVCTSSQCCQDHKDQYQLFVFVPQALELLKINGITAEDITKKHIYKFASPSGPS